MEIQLVYTGRIGGQAHINFHCGVKEVIMYRDEKNPRAKTRAIETGKEYISIEKDGTAKVYINSHNAKEVQRQIIAGNFELLYEEDKEILYRFGDFEEEIREEKKAMLEKAKLLKEEKIRSVVEAKREQERYDVDRKMIENQSNVIVKEIIKEVPVEKIIYQEKIVEVPEKRKVSKKTREAQAERMRKYHAKKKAEKESSEVEVKE